jgi:hypothetical protein
MESTRSFIKLGHPTVGANAMSDLVRAIRTIPPGIRRLYFPSLIAFIMRDVIDAVTTGSEFLFSRLFP